MVTRQIKVCMLVVVLSAAVLRATGYAQQPGASVGQGEPSKIETDKIKALTTELESVQRELKEVKETGRDEKKKADDRARVSMLISGLSFLVAIYGAGFSTWQYRTRRRLETPAAKGSPRLEWTRESDGFPKPDFRIEITNSTDKELRISQLTYYLRRPDSKEEKVIHPMDEKNRKIQPHDAIQLKIPRLRILDVIKVQAMGPTGSTWPISWNRKNVERLASFNIIETRFFRPDEAMVCVFQAGERFYVTSRSWSSEIHHNEWTIDFERQEEALTKFQEICAHLTVAGKESANFEDFHMISKVDLDEYWR